MHFKPCSHSEGILFEVQVIEPSYLQFSTARLGILWNSFSLEVTVMRLCTKAVAAIRTSYAPMGVPATFSLYLISAAENASSLVNGSIVTSVKKDVVDRLLADFTFGF